MLKLAKKVRVEIDRPPQSTVPGPGGLGAAVARGPRRRVAQPAAPAAARAAHPIRERRRRIRRSECQRQQSMETAADAEQNRAPYRFAAARSDPKPRYLNESTCHKTRAHPTPRCTRAPEPVPLEVGSPRRRCLQRSAGTGGCRTWTPGGTVPITALSRHRRFRARGSIGSTVGARRLMPCLCRSGTTRRWPTNRCASSRAACLEFSRIKPPVPNLRHVGACTYNADEPEHHRVKHQVHVLGPGQ